MRTTLTALLILLTTPALADGILPIRGAFGNDAGCTLFLTGQAPADDYMVVTPDTFTSNSVSCAFEHLTERSDATFVVSATCTGPGSGHQSLTVVDQGAAGYTVALEGQAAMGPLRLCEGSAALFAPQGVVA